MLTPGPLLAWREPKVLDQALGDLSAAAEALCGPELWGRPDGRALAALIEDLRGASGDVGTALAPADLVQVLRDAMDQVAVRPPWGGHPRVAIYGLLEARMSRADLVICAGLTEGSWPASPSPEPLLPPPVLRALGVPGGECRIGFAARDPAREFILYNGKSWPWRAFGEAVDGKVGGKRWDLPADGRGELLRVLGFNDERQERIRDLFLSRVELRRGFRGERVVAHVADDADDRHDAGVSI